MARITAEQLRRQGERERDRAQWKAKTAKLLAALKEARRRGEIAEKDMTQKLVEGLSGLRRAEKEERQRALDTKLESVKRMVLTLSSRDRLCLYWWLSEMPEVKEKV
jgi:hypothetical protein